MFDVAASLNGALGAAREGLAQAASQTARAQTQFGGSRTDAAMAGVAQKAIFTEALLSAVHARLAEIKSVTHG
jgi:riboflavin biosynthesis pyrimidine reductase